MFVTSGQKVLVSSVGHKRYSERHAGNAIIHLFRIKECPINANQSTFQKRPSDSAIWSLPLSFATYDQSSLRCHLKMYPSWLVDIKYRSPSNMTSLMHNISSLCPSSLATTFPVRISKIYIQGCYYCYQISSHCFSSIGLSRTLIGQGKMWLSSSSADQR